MPLRRGINLLSQRLEHLLRTTIESKRQAILLLNAAAIRVYLLRFLRNAQQCKYCD